MIAYRYGGEVHHLDDAEGLVVVRTGARLPLRMAGATPQLSDEGAAKAELLQPVTSFTEAGVEVFQTSPEERAGVTEVLHAEPAVEFAGRGLHDPDSKEPVVYTMNLFVKFAPGVGRAEVDGILGAHRLTVKRALPYAANAYFVAAPQELGREVFRIAEELYGDERVEVCHPELVREMAHKALADQWHLGRTTIGGQDVDAGARVREAWLHARGAGVTIAVIDDGVDVSHEEFSGPGKVVAARDVTRRVDGAAPDYADRHGMACAGVACAAGSHGAAGVAPDARLMPIRLVSALGSQDEADAIAWAADHGADVISCSWGPPDGDWRNPDDPRHHRHVPLPDATRLAIDYAVREGRGGRGCVITWAAGNGNEDVGCDGYASYPAVIAVGACNDRGVRSRYSDHGDALWCLFPSNDARDGDPGPVTPGIWTTDRPGKIGYNPGKADRGGEDGKYTNAFGGTSSAAPGVAGVAALMLEANPALTAREVKDLIAGTCDQIDAAGAGYGDDGRSPRYGYGRVDALGAVLRARPGAVPPPVPPPPSLERASLPFVAGYDPDFLGGGFRVPLPTPQCQGTLVGGGEVLDYIHYSVVMHRDRRTALFAAHNVDASQLQVVGGASWSFDQRIDRAFQTGNDAYRDNPWDKGHLARRAAVAWGPVGVAAAASNASYFYTNAAPQHQHFNREEWVALEDWILRRAGEVATRLCVLTGPIYTQHDLVEQGYRIPSAFWKVVALRDPTAAGADLSALGFVMKQNELWDQWNGAALLDLTLYEVGIVEIGRYAGIDFGELAQLDEFEWRQPRFKDRRRMRPIRIEGPGDIEFNGDRRRARGARAAPRGLPGRPEREADPADAPPPPAPAPVVQLAERTARLLETVETLVPLEPTADDDDVRAAQRELIDVYERIVGGRPVDWNAFPHCCCVGYGDQWFCSGVLIGPRLVLTAAHCAPAIDRVYLGGRALTLMGFVGEVALVERVEVHPGYGDEVAPADDLALLVLAEPAVTAPVAIATAAELAAAGNVELVGFGYSHPTLSIGFGTKRQVNVPLTSTAGVPAAEVALLQEWHGFDAAHEFHAGRKFLGMDSCYGDSGGPAYVDVGGDWKLAGITSRAAFSSEAPCGDGGIYTRVDAYREWIDAVDPGAGVAAPAERTATEVYVSACLPNPVGRDRGHEWVEVTNTGAAAVDLGGFRIVDRQGGSHQLAGPLGAGATRRFVLPPESAVRLANAGDEITLFHGDVALRTVDYSNAGSGQIISFAAPPLDLLLPDADPC